VGVAVPARIGVGRKPEVRRQIDDARLGRARQQILDDLLRRAVRQRTERDVERGGGPIKAVDRLQRRQDVRRELRKHRRHLLTGAAVGREQRDLGMRMSQQQAHQLRPGIAGGAEHADFCLGLGSHETILRNWSGLPRRMSERQCRGREAGGRRNDQRSRAGAGALVRRRRRFFGPIAIMRRDIGADRRTVKQRRFGGPVVEVSW
jgi:hypothetical protein